MHDFPPIDFSRHEDQNDKHGLIQLYGRPCTLASMDKNSLFAPLFYPGIMGAPYM